MRRGLPHRVDLDKREPCRLYEKVEYEDFWTGLQRSKLDELEHDIVRRLLPVAGQRIIDVGCGYGRLADCYMDRFQQVIMADGSMSLLRHAFEKSGGRAICVACDVNHLPFRPAAFDAALMVRVFHHIADSEHCLSELHRILCNNGRLIFTYCNKRNALRIAQWLVNRKKENPFSTEASGVGSTVISHHPQAVHEMLIDSGNANIRYYGSGVFDVLAGSLGSVGRWVPPGTHLSGLLGSSKLAPWVFCGADARGNQDLVNAGEIADLLQCPSCGSHLSKDDQGYVCATCKRHYPVEDGIIDMRV